MLLCEEIECGRIDKGNLVLWFCGFMEQLGWLGSWIMQLTAVREGEFVPSIVDLYVVVSLPWNSEDYWVCSAGVRDPKFDGFSVAIDIHFDCAAFCYQRVLSLSLVHER